MFGEAYCIWGHFVLGAYALVSFFTERFMVRWLMYGMFLPGLLTYNNFYGLIRDSEYLLMQKKSFKCV